MKVTIAMVPPDAIAETWPAVAPMLAKAIPYSYGRSTLQNALMCILNGDDSLWVAYDAETNDLMGALTIKIMTYPGKRMVSGHLLGGEHFEEWVQPMQAALEEYGKKFGCTAIELCGRVGWGKMMAKYGYRPTLQTIEKEFT